MSKKRKKAQRKKKNRRGRAKLPVSVARVTAAGFRFETLIDAAAEMDIEPDLGELLDEYPKLAAAWEKGQFYRRLYNVACHMFAESQAAKQLDTTHEKFRELLKSDRRAKQLWEEGRMAFWIRCKEAMMEAVRDGKTHAIARIENLLRAEFAATESSDYGLERVPMQVAAQLIGVTRVTLHRYHREKGLERNSDGTYNLKVLVPWIIQYTETKMLKGGGETVTDLQRYERGLEIRQRRLEKEGYLADTRDVVHGLLLREQAFIDAQKNAIEELAGKLENKSYDERVTILSESFNRQRSERMRLPESINLPADGRAMLEKLISLLQPKDGQEMIKDN